MSRKAGNILYGVNMGIMFPYSPPRASKKHSECWCIRQFCWCKIYSVMEGGSETRKVQLAGLSIHNK